MNKKKIIFFDGVCNMCNHFVRWIITLDKKREILFSPLQGETAKKILKDFPEKITNTNSVIFYNNQKTHIKSRAIIEIIYELGSAFRIIIILKLIPTFILDSMYNLIAKNRYAWFGKRKKCLVPDKINVSRFLD